jgi:hypothetical protein
MIRKKLLFAGAAGAILLSSGAANAVTFATEPFVRGAHANAKAYTDAVAGTKQNSLPSAVGNNGMVLGVTDATGTLGWVVPAPADTSALETRIGNVESEITNHGDIVTRNASEFATTGDLAAGLAVKANAAALASLAERAYVDDVVAGLGAANLCAPDQVLTSDGTGGYVCGGVTPDVFVP